MPKNNFNFEVYRLNLVDNTEILPNFLEPLKLDEDVVDIIRSSSNDSRDIELSGRERKYLWSIRQFCEYDMSDFKLGTVVTFTLARSVVYQVGQIVTEDDIVNGISESEHPIADIINLFFFMKRHLVVVERNTVTYQKQWKEALKKILAKESSDRGFYTYIDLEPKPEEHKLISTFLSFEKLTRLKIHLRLPNPELTRLTQKLYDDLEAGGIRDYIQDMKNPRGINRNQENRPFASVAMAEAGYKFGEVQMEGIKDNTFRKIKTGNEAARGNVHILKDFIRGLSANTKTKETTKILKAISDELERIAPNECNDEE